MRQHQMNSEANRERTNHISGYTFREVLRRWQVHVKMMTQDMIKCHPKDEVFRDHEDPGFERRRACVSPLSFRWHRAQRPGEATDHRSISSVVSVADDRLSDHFIGFLI